MYYKEFTFLIHDAFITSSCPQPSHALSRSVHMSLHIYIQILHNSLTETPVPRHLHRLHHQQLLVLEIILLAQCPVSGILAELLFSNGDCESSKNAFKKTCRRFFFYLAFNMTSRLSQCFRSRQRVLSCRLEGLRGCPAVKTPFHAPSDAPQEPLPFLSIIFQFHKTQI